MYAKLRGRNRTALFDALTGGLRIASVAVAGLCALLLCLALPAVSSAHSLDAADGRIPGQPDYQKIRGVINRFNPKTDEYVKEEPGEPVQRAHIEGGDLSTSEGDAALGGYQPLPPMEAMPICANSGHRLVMVRAFDEETKLPTRRTLIFGRWSSA